MKTQTPACLLIASLIALLVGCGKTENPAAQPVTEKPPKAEEAKSVAPVQPQTPLPTTTTANATATNVTSKLATTTATQVASAPPPATRPLATGTPTKVPEITATPVPAAPPPTTPTTLATLSQDQVVKGLQEALGKGLQQAIARLGHDGGFLTNLNVKIPMPEKLQKVESALRTMKQDKLADDFVATMNHAAEQAVPEAGGVFADALKQMSIDDAKSILTGPNDAATQYFRRTTQTNLYAKFYPIVKRATEQTRVTAAYKGMVEKVNVGGISQKLGGLGSAISGTLLDNQTVDLDAYVTNKALDGLFKMVADEEKRIRENPVARTTDLLQTVFGVLKK